jgi:hypothetical protein
VGAFETGAHMPTSETYQHHIRLLMQLMILKRVAMKVQNDKGLHKQVPIQKRVDLLFIADTAATLVWSPIRRRILSIPLNCINNFRLELFNWSFLNSIVIKKYIEIRRKD